MEEKKHDFSYVISRQSARQDIIISQWMGRKKNLSHEKEKKKKTKRKKKPDIKLHERTKTTSRLECFIVI